MRTLWRGSQRGAVFLPLAVAVVGVGVVFSMVTSVIIAASDSPQIIGPALTGGGTALAVSIAGWIARKILAGEVVPLPIKQLLDLQQKQIDTLQLLVTGIESGNAELRRTLRDATDALAVRRAMHPQEPPV